MKNTILTFGTIVAFIAGTTLLSSCGSGTPKDADATEQHDMNSDHEHDANSDHSETMAATHVCPMHPEITGIEGDKCSKCGMALTLVEASEEEQNQQH